MPSLRDRLTQLARSPQARRLLDRAKDQARVQARKPENRARLEKVARRLRTR